MVDKSSDESHLEKRYFIDSYRYNCPYCNIRNVEYSVYTQGSFDWTDKKQCFYYVVQCTRCDNKSLHLSYYELSMRNEHLACPPSHKVYLTDGKEWNWGPILKDGKKVELLDDVFFYHQPTSFFTIDSRIPEKIRSLISEADGCRKMAYLVGASGCLRKAIYELLKIQEIPKKLEDKELSYEVRIKQLKEKFFNIDSDYFDILAGIQGMTSDNLHEGSWDSFDLSAFTLLLETTKEILYEIYVLPDEKKGRKLLVQQLREGFNKKTKIEETVKTGS